METPLGIGLRLLPLSCKDLCFVVCVWGGVGACKCWCPQRPEELGPPEAEIKSSCELTDMDGGTE